MMATKGLVAVALALAVCALSAALAEVQFKSVQLSTHRLPTNVNPLHYHVDLDFNQSQGYTGKVRIEVEFTGPTSDNKVSRCLNKLTNHVLSGLSESNKCKSRLVEKNRIVLHKDKSVRLDSVRVFKVSSKDADKVKELKIKSLGEDQQKQLIAIDMPSELPPAGTHGILELTFGGQYRTDKTGFYQSVSRVRGVDYVQVAAKFQPTFARLALPCFDEPSYKAKFSLAIKHAAKQQAYATTDLESREAQTTDTVVISKFKETPKMSIHMVAFTVGEFDEPLEVQVRDNLRLRAITPVHRRESGAYALEVAKFALQWFERFIDFEFPLEKLDIVAFSDMDTDNTETWGLTFVKDIYALVDDETKPDSRITTAVNVAHVVVHQWFANLITAEWWNDMWITESVAAQMAFEIVADLFPEQSPYFVRISTLSGVLTSDSSGKNHSLSPPESELSTSSKVYELFDNIQFMKSGALARLQQDTLGREEFRRVLQKIVRRHAYGNVEFSDLLSAISESPASAQMPMKEILASWKSMKSYPVINVAIDQTDKQTLVLYEQPRQSIEDTVVDASRRMLKDRWVLPVKVLISDATGKRQVTKNVVLGTGFSDSSILLPNWFELGQDFVKVSPDPSLATYYRVRYSDQLLQPLEVPISEKMLATMDRLHLLDDSRALAAGSLIAPDTFKQILGWHATETEAAMIIEMLLAVQTLNTLDTTYSTPSPASQVFMELFQRAGFRVTGEETLLEQRARMVTLNALITKKVQEVIDAGVKAFEESNGQVALFLREPVYAAVVAAGSEEQLNQMLEHLKRTESHEEQIRLANALSVYTRGLDILNDLGRWLETCDLKASEKATIQAKLSNSLVEAVKLQEGSQ